MTTSPMTKTVILFFTVLGVVVSTFALAVQLHTDRDHRVEFRLTNHSGDPVTEKSLGGRHLLVFFGFTSCHDVCPTQMSKLTQVMEELDRTGHGARITPVFITVDPERDTPEKMHEYLAHFDHRFQGLTGSRPALKDAAHSFKTLLEERKPDAEGDYQITHASVSYLVDPFSRIIDYIPGTADIQLVADKIRETI